MTRVPRSLTLGFSLVLTGCTGPPLPAEALATLGGEDQLATLKAIDRLEDHGDPAAGPYLLALQRNRSRPLPIRARAAAALLALGYPQGEGFCLAVLGAMLPGSEERDRAFDLPQSERWAFPRELAVRALRNRLHAAGATVPPYDVNLGAPQMVEAVGAFEKALGSLTPPHPYLSPSELRQRIPENPPPGWEGSNWRQIRASILDRK